MQFLFFKKWNSLPPHLSFCMFCNEMLLENWSVGASAVGKRAVGTALNPHSSTSNSSPC